MNKQDWEEIINLSWIKSLDKELISEIKESTSIKRFKAGTILSNKENIQSEVFFILEGNARITFNYKNDFYTIEKLKKDDWIGLISYLRNSPIEEVISITDIKLLSISDELIIKIINNNKNQKFTIGIQLIEVIDLIVRLNKSENNDFKVIFDASKKLKSNIKLKNNLNGSTDKDNLYILGSNNVKQKIIGDQINSNDLRKKYIDKIDLRLLEINKNIFYKILDDINIEITNENNSSMLPLPSAINLGGLNNEEIYIKGDGPFEEGLACLKMICKIFKVNKC